MSNNDNWETNTKEPGCLGKFAIVFTLLISWLFFQRRN